jgi:hypothetical protein
MTTRVTRGTRVMNERIAYEVAIGNAPVAYLDELPNEGTKITKNNANDFIGSIIVYKVSNQYVYSKIESVTPTMIKVIDLDFIIAPYGILFYENNTPNPVTCGYLGFGRAIHVVANAELLERMI